MIPIETIVLFLTASVALALAPGPDNIFVLTQSALYGRKAGLLITLGLCTGLLVHTAAISLGVAATFQTSVMAFTIFKIVGALYLLYLAFKAWTARASRLDVTGDQKLSRRKLYTLGIFMNITNPKVAIFFLAFLPQFANPSIGSITTQMLIFGALFIFVTLLVFGSVAWFAGFFGEVLRRSEKTQIIMNRIAGIVFIGLALRLTLE